MAQPLMVTSSPAHASVPPAQAEALYDAALENNAKHSSAKDNAPHERPAAWPGEDWDEPSALPSPLPRAPAGNASGRFL